MYFYITFVIDKGKMTLKDIYKRFPRERDCISFFEHIIWNDKPVCPYCKHHSYSAMKKEDRYHCNNCDTSYSVTVGTIFKKTKIDLRKWLFAIYELNANPDTSARELAKKIGVTKDSAWLMTKKITRGHLESKDLLQRIIDNL